MSLRLLAVNWQKCGLYCVHFVWIKRVFKSLYCVRDPILFKTSVSYICSDILSTFCQYKPVGLTLCSVNNLV